VHSIRTFGNESCIFHVNILTFKALCCVCAVDLPLGSGGGGAERGVASLLVEVTVVGNSP